MQSNQQFDFGFDSEEFTGTANTVPYVQFLNGNENVFGLAITKSNADLAEFKPSSAYLLSEYNFDDGTRETLYLCDKPRMLVINRSEPLMSKDNVVVRYDKEKYQEGDWKAFSYAVVWLVDENNQPLSELPFRLKCSGFAGITFLKNYSYYSNPDSFTKKFLAVYKELTGDRTINKNEVFYAHAVYQIELVREKATSSHNGKSSMAVQTKRFLCPTKENFGNLIIRNGSPFSEKIKTAIEETQSWLKSSAIAEAVESSQEGFEQLPEKFMALKAKEPATTSFDEENEEYVQLIKQAAVKLEWTKRGLNAFLIAKYNSEVDQLNTLPEHVLIQIYDAIQDPRVIAMFSPQSAFAQTEATEQGARSGIAGVPPVVPTEQEDEIPF